MFDYLNNGEDAIQTFKMSRHGKYFLGYYKPENKLIIESFTSVEQMFTKEVDGVPFGRGDYGYKEL